MTDLPTRLRDKLAMTGNEAEEAARRLEIHLRRNEFEACQNIITALSEKDTSEGMITTVAEINQLPIRVANYLERLGYIFLNQLEDITEKDLEDVPYLSERYAKDAINAIVKARHHNEHLRRRRIRERDEAELENVR